MRGICIWRLATFDMDPFEIAMHRDVVWLNFEDPHINKT
jgi:hypothetical protein